MTIHKIAVIGAGPQGRDFTLRCLQAGLPVVLEDVMPANLRRAEQQAEQVLPPALAQHLRLAGTVEEAVRDADVAIDFVPDELESKLEIFSLLDRMAPPHTILCTPTATLSITDLGSCTYRPERCIGLRPASDGSLSAPLGVIAGRDTSPAVLESVFAWLRLLGLAPQAVEDLPEPMLVKNL